MVIYLFYYPGWSRRYIAALFKHPGYVLSHCIYRGQERRDIKTRVSKYPCKMQSILGQPVGIIRRCDESDDATTPISNQGIDIGGQLSSQVAGTYLYVNHRSLDCKYENKTPYHKILVLRYYFHFYNEPKYTWVNKN
jgi:hypothetical protein